MARMPLRPCYTPRRPSPGGGAFFVSGPSHFGRGAEDGFRPVADILAPAQDQRMVKPRVCIGALLLLIAASCSAPSPTASCGVNFCLPDGYSFAQVQADEGTFIYMALPGDGTGIIIMETDRENWPLGGGAIRPGVVGRPLPLRINDRARLVPSNEPGGAEVDMYFPESVTPHLRLSGFCRSPSSCVVADFAGKLRPR